MITAIGTVLFLIFLEGILSFDNALVLAVLAEGLPKEQRKKALTYGMWGAMGFRFLALIFLTYLTKFVFIKFFGAGYLLYLCFGHFFKDQEEDKLTKAKEFNFWKTILMIELTDIAFSSDSILASLGVSNKLWVLFTGGILGIALMRFAAILFLNLIEKFPALETSAYLLVGTIGSKLLIEGFNFRGIDFQDPRGPAFALFWGLMASCVVMGFLPEEEDVAV